LHSQFLPRLPRVAKHCGQVEIENTNKGNNILKIQSILSNKVTKVRVSEQQESTAGLTPFLERLPIKASKAPTSPIITLLYRIVRPDSVKKPVSLFTP